MDRALKLITDRIEKLRNDPKDRADTEELLNQGAFQKRPELVLHWKSMLAGDARTIYWTHLTRSYQRALGKSGNERYIAFLEQKLKELEAGRA